MNKNFDLWNNKKKVIEQKSYKDFARPKEVWWCSVGLNIGDEEDGKNADFERPVLVIKSFNRKIVLIIPLSTKIKDNPYYFPLQYHNKKSSLILSQIKLVSTKRLTRRIYTIDTTIFKQIRDKIILTIL